MTLEVMYDTGTLEVRAWCGDPTQFGNFNPGAGQAVVVFPMDVADIPQGSDYMVDLEAEIVYPTTFPSPNSENRGLVNKGGAETTDGSGEAVVTYVTPYPDTDYFIQLTAGASPDAVICFVKSGTKTVDGFTLVSFDDGGKKEVGVPVYWCTGPYSNP